jgi:LPS-assembly protein
MAQPTAFWFAALLFSVVFLFPDLSFSQEVPTPSERMPVPGLGKFSKGKEPIDISADRLEYDQQKNVYTATGHVVVIQAQSRLTAEHVVLDNTTGLLTAEGQVELTEKEDVVRAERTEVNLNTSQGVLYHGRIDTQKENYHIEGERMERLSKDVYLIDQGSLTTCDACAGSAPAWRFRTKRLKLNLDHYASATGMAFYIKDVPVLYFPYLVFPVKTTRQSGLLLPRIGYNTEEGVKYVQPFYWAIGYSQDATISLDYRSSKGVGGILDYRYVLSRTALGNLQTLYFHDWDAQKENLDLRYRHTQQFTRSLDLRTDINYLNDPDVRRDLSSVTSERTQSSLESNLFIRHRTDLHSLLFLTRFSQDLLAPSNALTLQRLPELDYALTEFPVGNLPVLFGGDFSAANFWRKDEVEDPTDPFAAQLRAFRTDLFPKLWRPLDLNGLATLTPQAGFRETYYSRGVENHQPVHREIPYGALELKSPWVRHYGSRNFHLVEPSIQYEYADMLQKESVPQFDQVDLANDKNLITYGLTNRVWIGSGSGLLRLTHSYNLDRSERELSDLRTEWQLRPRDWVFIDQDAFYNFYDHRFTSVNTDAVMRWSPFLEVSAGHRFTRQGLISQKGDIFNPLSLGETINQAQKIEFLTGRANLYLYWPMYKKDSGNGLYFATKAYYNLDTDGFAEIDYGLKYSAQCWELVVDYQDFPDKNQISFMITLKGAVTVDSRSAGGLFDPKTYP